MSTLPLVAVIQFPGSNCEYETARVVREAGMNGLVFRWNQLSELRDADPDAFVLPGGFSFQDRVRAGAVAAKEMMMDIVFSAAAGKRPVLGICNGAQVLVESGLVPGWEAGRVEAALAANHIAGRSGYLSRWVFLHARETAVLKSPWLGKLGTSPIPVPIAHAEGRFVFWEEDLSRTLPVEALVYCDENGVERPEYPTNPNGSVHNLAAVMNTDGNVMAMMPHPERAFRLWQLPPWIPGEWGDRIRMSISAGTLADAPGPGALFFQGLADHFGGGRHE
ncbi:MAG: phosphoribosylformylglycinamidine synthase I [Candidatus Fermentibacteraceae bacterium]|nr:phosphoribosylformylglycinamidine synthase I [Candidatus Fermentibacteraceae bacterium]